MDFGKWEQAGQGWGKVGRGTGILKKRGHVCMYVYMEVEN